MHDVIESAIKLLEHPTIQPEEHTEKRTETHACDTIYKQVAVDAVLSAIPYDKYWAEQVKKAIWSLPPAEPERKKGHWIDAVISTDNGDLLVQVCDQCNAFFPLAYTGGGHHFCPNCGADMSETKVECGNDITAKPDKPYAALADVLYVARESEK